MFIFCAFLSLILIVAKIFSLITLGWWLCLAPMLAYIAVWAVIVILAIVSWFILALLG